MKNIYFLFLIFFAGFVQSCSQKDYSSDVSFSPSGDYMFISTVNRTNKLKDDYAYVYISVFNKEGKLLSSFNTSSGDLNKWAVAWTSTSDILILNSADIGVKAWKVEDNKISSLALTKNIISEANRIMKEKFHR